MAAADSGLESDCASGVRRRVEARPGRGCCGSRCAAPRGSLAPGNLARTDAAAVNVYRAREAVAYTT